MKEALILQRAKSPQGITFARCSLYAESTTNERPDTLSSGTCCCPLFSGRSMVTGYPILRRPAPNTGLELSLRTMSLLINASQVSQLDTCISMKGYNSLFNARRAFPGFVLWHLVFTDHEDERISYDDSRVIAVEGEYLGGLRQLECARHIVGWCKKATDLCGEYHRVARSAYKSRASLTDFPSRTSKRQLPGYLIRHAKASSINCNRQTLSRGRSRRCPWPERGDQQDGQADMPVTRKDIPKPSLVGDAAVRHTP